MERMNAGSVSQQEDFYSKRGEIKAQIGKELRVCLQIPEPSEALGRKADGRFYAELPLPDLLKIERIWRYIETAQPGSSQR
jgi:hypothetical protein